MNSWCSENSTEKASDPVGIFLQAVPTDQQRTVWRATLAGWCEGMGLGSGVSVEDVHAGLSEYLASVAEPTYAVAHVRAFVTRAHRTRTQPAAARRPESLAEYFASPTKHDPPEAA